MCRSDSSSLIARETIRFLGEADFSTVSECILKTKLNNLDHTLIRYSAELNSPNCFPANFFCTFDGKEVAIDSTPVKGGARATIVRGASQFNPYFLYFRPSPLAVAATQVAIIGYAILMINDLLRARYHFILAEFRLKPGFRQHTYRITCQTVRDDPKNPCL